MAKKPILNLLKVSLLATLVLSLVLFQAISFAKDEGKTGYGKKMITYAKGSVVDISTGQKCKKATITYVSDDGSSKSIKTDKNGDFVIDKLETGYYNWYVECDGYQKASYTSYPVISGGNNYMFEISKVQIVSRTFELQTQTEGVPGDPFPFSEVVKSLHPNEDSVSIMQYYSDTGGPCPYVPTSVKVLRTNANNTIVTVDLEDYIGHVVCREMDPAYYIYDGMSDPQKTLALKAQAIVARGYATYHYYVERRHSTSSGYDFCDTTSCQVYDPTYSPALALQAAKDTAAAIPAIVSGGPYNWNIDYIDSVFFASCKGSTINSEDSPSFGTYRSYLRGVTCPYDIRPTLISGHRVGFCQDGAAGYAKSGTVSWPSEIVSHYYTGVTTVTGRYH